ncbi:hypothetical protein GGS20DRAFT_591639 [Poronia punctata]|nr:hypothetical protein GGS20DRAFT_591639 [Poronia punctata]
MSGSWNHNEVNEEEGGRRRRGQSAQGLEDTSTLHTRYQLPPGRRVGATMNRQPRNQAPGTDLVVRDPLVAPAAPIRRQFNNNNPLLASRPITYMGRPEPPRYADVQAPLRAWTGELGISPNYNGDLELMARQMAPVDPAESSSVWVTNLPPTCTYPMLLQACRTSGKIYSTMVNEPQNDKGHLTCAAKIVFFTPEGRHRLQERSRIGTFVVGGFLPMVRPNRILTAVYPIDAEQAAIARREGADEPSRVITIQGPEHIVNLQALEVIFHAVCSYDGEYVKFVPVQEDRFVNGAAVQRVLPSPPRPLAQSQNPFTPQMPAFGGAQPMFGPIGGPAHPQQQHRPMFGPIGGPARPQQQQQQRSMFGPSTLAPQGNPFGPIGPPRDELAGARESWLGLPSRSTAPSNQRPRQWGQFFNQGVNNNGIPYTSQPGNTSAPGPPVPREDIAAAMARNAQLFQGNVQQHQQHQQNQQHHQQHHQQHQHQQQQAQQPPASRRGLATILVEEEFEQEAQYFLNGNKIVAIEIAMGSYRAQAERCYSAMQGYKSSGVSCWSGESITTRVRNATRGRKSPRKGDGLYNGTGLIHSFPGALLLYLLLLGVSSTLLTPTTTSTWAQLRYDPLLPLANKRSWRPKNSPIRTQRPIRGTWPNVIVVRDMILVGVEFAGPGS